MEEMIKSRCLQRVTISAEKAEEMHGISPGDLLLAVIAVGVGAATVAGVDVAGGGHVEGAVEVVAGALAVEHARRGVVEKAGGEVGNAKHLRPQHSRLSVLTHARNSTITTARALKMCSL